MTELWQAVAELALEMHPRRLAGVAEKVASLAPVDGFDVLRSTFGPSASSGAVERLEDAWRKSENISSSELAAALMGAVATAKLAGKRESIELVWTGPSVGTVPVRHTEQVLCEVINSVRHRLFLVSFVAYDVTSIARALRNAINRQVQVDVLLESSSRHGGSVSFDSVRAMKGTVPAANVFVWKQDGADDNNRNRGARSVHAKCAVGDGELAFITSANLSTAAMERNMELGVLVRGGSLPGNLDRHLDSLIMAGVVQTA